MRDIGRSGATRANGARYRVVKRVFLWMALLAAPLDGRAASECATLKGVGAQVTGGNATHFQPGAFALTDRASVALFDESGNRTFGTLRLARHADSYEAYWQPQAGGRRYLLVLNGTAEAALMTADTHWPLPFPPGTVVGPLSVTSCAGLAGSR